MSYVLTDPDYTDPNKRNANTTERVGDISGKVPTNDVTDRNVASKLASLLEGLTFPASKEEIKK